MGEPVDVIAYYRKQAQENGLLATITMPDEIVVDLEIGAITSFIEKAVRDRRQRVLEVGCGNGYLAEVLAKKFGNSLDYCGIDYTDTMIELALQRKLPAKFVYASVLQIPLPDQSVDLVISDRVLINLLDPVDQTKAFAELARVIPSGGKMMLIEGFKEGLTNLNRARAEFGATPIPEPIVNNWFTEARWGAAIQGSFREFSDAERADLPPENLFSTHYFMTRFVHDILRPPEGKVRNTEFARFFSQALPPVGDYSPLRVKYLCRI